MRRGFLAGLALIAVAALFPSGAAASSPHAFDDDLDAALATDGSSLWLGVMGRDGHGRSALRVYRKEDGWERLPAVQWTPSHDDNLSLTEAPAGVELTGPCVGMVSNSRPVVACQDDSGWARLRFGGVADDAGSLSDLRVIDGQLVALFSRAHRLRVLAYTPDGWDHLGPTIPIGQAIAGLGQGAVAKPPIDVAVEEFPRRSVWTLTGGIWEQGEELTGVGEGPQIGGSVRTADRLLLPVTDAEDRPWSFGIYSSSGGEWQPVGSPLSTGKGFAQGQLDVAGGAVWASWQEDDPRTGRARIFASRFDPDTETFDPRIEIWSGRRIGPGALGVVEAAGRTYALFARSSRGDPFSGLVAAVRPLSP